MPRQFEPRVDALHLLKARPAVALREAIREGYRFSDFRSDLLAGLVVGIVALPLSMALAIATGVPPQFGLYTAIIAGALIALLGGSRVQVSGPTAAFVVILAPITAQYGLQGLLIATLLAGGMLVIMGVLGLGRLIEFIPYPVTTGFTAGIAVVIATLQIKDFLGLEIESSPEHYVDRVREIAAALPTISAADTAIGVTTLVLLLLWPRLTRRVPAALIALPFAAVLALIAHRVWPESQVATIASRFGGIPRTLPVPGWPWSFPGPGGGELVIDFSTLRALIISAFAIAMLGAIESLLSAVVADGMTGRKHNPDSELLAQGIGNLVATFFGGFAATGAIARTATNIRAGARSPIAAIIHAGFVLTAVVALAPLLGYLPMASLAALLLVVAWNMAEIKHFAYVIRVAPRSDAVVLVTCFGLTVIFDMVVAVSAGVVLAAVLFMRRMAEVSGITLVSEHPPELGEPLPEGVVLYEIAGPLFFGAAQKAMSALQQVGNGVRIVILDVESVPAIDATGLVNLQSTIRKLLKMNIFVILGGVQRQPMDVLTRAGLEKSDSRIGICRSLQEAVTMSRFHWALGDELHLPTEPHEPARRPAAAR